MNRVALAGLWCLAVGIQASAHEGAGSRLELTVEGMEPHGRWTVPLAELDAVLILDRNADGAVTSGELAASLPVISQEFLACLSLEWDGALLRPAGAELRLDITGGGVCVVVEFPLRLEPGGRRPAGRRVRWEISRTPHPLAAVEVTGGAPSAPFAGWICGDSPALETTLAPDGGSREKPGAAAVAGGAQVFSSERPKE